MRATRMPSLPKIFNGILSTLIGLALAISLTTHLWTISPFSAPGYISLGLGAALAYILLTRLIQPAWKAWTPAERWSGVGVSTLTAALLVGLVSFSPDSPDLAWRCTVGPHAGQLAIPFEGQSWGATATVLELHATDQPDDPGTQWVWRATADLSDVLHGAAGRLRFQLTQPEWAVIDPQTGQAFQGADGVTVVFKIEQEGTWQTVQQVELNLHAQSNQRRWQTVEVDVPAGTRQLAVEALPGPPGSNNWCDRVWVNIGRKTEILPNNVIKLAEWLSMSFFVCLAVSAIFWLSQVQRVRYLTPSRLWTALSRFGPLFIALICLTLGYMFVWQRGFYMDDYANKLMAIDVLTGQWRPIWSLSRIPTFPVRILSCMVVTSFAGLLPTHEFFVRAISTLGIGVNALLLGWLIYRILGSRLAAVISGWLFLMPIYAQEAVLWAGAATYVFAAGFALLFLHVSWNALTQPQRAGRWIALGTLAFATTLLFVEQFTVAAGLVLIFGLTIAARRQTASCWALLKRSLYVLIWPLAVAAIFYVLFYTNCELVDRRGGLDLSLAGIVKHSLGDFKRLAWMTVSENWGQRLTGDAFGIGIAVLLRSWKGMALSLAASVSLLLTVLAWRTGEREYLPRYRVGLVVFCAGVTWFVVSLLFPGVLVKGQILEYRQLYFPTAGAGVGIGALAWMAAKRLRRLECDKLFVAIAGVLLLLSTICMVGYAQAFAVRYELDRRQIAELVHALPAQHLPENSYVVPFNNEERLFGKDNSISMVLVGAFEIPSSTRAVLEEAYRRNDLQIITTNRWVPMQFSYVGDQEPSSNQLGIQGVSVPVDRTVLFSYRAGSVFLIESLTITKSDGSQHTVQFPIARDLHRHGVPTISIVVPN